MFLAVIDLGSRNPLADRLIGAAPWGVAVLVLAAAGLWYLRRRGKS